MVPLSVQKRRFARRTLARAVNPLRVRARVLTGREQHHEVGGLPLVLPPDHNLPFYQRRDPTYDAYAIELVRRLGDAPLTVLDLGANVGDTAVAMLSVGPHVQVRAVEGAPHFLRYLRRNVAPYAERVEVVDRFVGPVADLASFTRHGSTGSFRPRAPGDESHLTSTWVSPAELLSGLDGRRVVWKSDMDGFDIHVLASHWELVDGACDVVWFEYSPVGTLGPREDVARLVQAIATSGRHVAVYDNVGHPMLTLSPGTPVSEGLAGLTRWLHEQRKGLLSVPYVDVWAVQQQYAEVLRG
jgi:FkbM family methyltransferase